MFAFMEGTIAELSETGIVLENGGIGYEILMPTTALSRLAGQRDLVRIYTSFQVSENNVALYGFFSAEEKRFFLQLLTVNGVGPKAAIALLGTLSVEDLRFAIIAEDVKAISAAPGLGPKTAKRIILDLKDKIDAAEAVESRLSPAEEGVPSNKSDALAALVALGYSSSDALRAISAEEPDENAPVEDVIRRALARLV